MKRAVVLSGGGTKGAYELGVWKALKELNIDYQIVTGTSIGSINGALMCIGDLEDTEKMWRSLTMSDFMNENHETGRNIKRFFANMFSLEESSKNNDSSGAVDNSPFKDFIEKIIDEEKIRTSPVDYGLVTVRSHDRKPFMLTKSEIPEGLLKDYIIASSSVYPVFSMHKINGELYIDGMYHDNLPIDLAVAMGAGELIVVDLHQEPQHPNYAGRPYVTYITPSENLGGILEFDPTRISKNIDMGYRDAMRAFGVHSGYVYSFKPDSLKGYSEAIEIFNQSCAQGEAAIGIYSKGKHKKKKEIYRMFYYLEQFARGNAIKKGDYFIRGAEISAEIFGLTHEKNWEMPELVSELLAKLKPAKNYPEAKRITGDMKEREITKLIASIIKEKGDAYLVSCLYYAEQSDPDAFMGLLPVVKAYPKEFVAALFLYSVTV